jgi:hypothetical protein
MTSVEAWNIFKKTGKIFDYLIFVTIRRFECNKE